jgi:hypothetical protein
MRATLTTAFPRRTHILIADDREAGMKALDTILREAKPHDMSEEQWRRELEEKGWDYQLVISDE